MKRSLKSVLALICVLLLAASIPLAAFAQSYRINIGTSYSSLKVAASSSGHSFYIKVYNTGYGRNDIRMLDKNGRVIWQESGAIAFNGNRTFWCGSNVATIQIKTQTSSAAVYAYDCY